MKELTKKLKLILTLLLAISFFGCDDDDDNLPQVVAGFTFTQNMETGTVTFINISEEATAFEWDFGNGATSTEVNPIFTFSNGTFTVTLEASNVAGASATFEDEIIVQVADPDPGFDAGLLTNGDFENGTEPWIGGGLNIVTEEDNSFNSVNVEVAGNPFDVNLSQVVELTQGTNYILTFDASASVARSILAGIGLNEAPFTNTAPEVNLTTETQTFTLQLSAADFGGANSRVLFDMGAEIGMVVIDNVSLVEGGDGSDTNGGGGGFDSGLLTNGDFENGGDPWIGNALNVQTDGGNSFNFADVQTAGQPFAVNLSQVVEITQGTNYILTFDASSDQARTMLAGIGLNVEPFTNTAPEVNLTTETQTFTLQLAANGFGGADSRVLFDMGADVGTVVIDNVSLVEGGDGSDTNGGGGGFDSGLLTNGDFENGGDPWIGNALNVQTDGGNSFNFADVQTAGQPFAVNLSQVVEITQGTNYILTFDASSDQARTMLAGIGLNVEPFTNTAPEVNLTTETQTFTLQLAANDFGGADSRVLFDMGADVGTVVIDNVSLIEDTSGGSGSGVTALSSLPADFENGEEFSAVFEPASVNGSITANVVAGGINTSPNIYTFNKPEGTEFFGGMENVFATPLDLTTARTFRVQIYSTKPNVVVRFELQTRPDGPNFSIDQTVVNANEWVELTFDFGPVTNGDAGFNPNIYNAIVIIPDFDPANDPTTTSETYYIDNIILE
ncbi:hypothetical protein MTsPCn5_27950 [Croceitalea sp. MTPC5]|uniref:PKD domain-containing protein n=1 Tax=Croceitalea sp. MTPC5 TaxID=3056565 RepID=UPI002B3D0D92|nr:hypothetical protein MTsPCn5_27950 [Croceitalea sp. MTPC5]